MYRDNYYDLSVYHSQQCVEKALKGYLCFRNHVLLKTHDLRILLKPCISYDADFNNIVREALNINELDIRFRYPAPMFEPPKAATFEAIEQAETVLNFVKTKII